MKMAMVRCCRLSVLVTRQDSFGNEVVRSEIHRRPSRRLGSQTSLLQIYRKPAFTHRLRYLGWQRLVELSPYPHHVLDLGGRDRENMLQQEEASLAERYDIVLLQYSVMRTKLAAGKVWTSMDKEDDESW